MGQMLIRNLDDEVIADIKRRAETQRISAEEEARRTLTASVPLNRNALIAELNAIAKANGPQTGSTSLEILRQYRYPDGDD